MKIKYCRKRLRLSLFFGVSWIILGVVYQNTSVHGSFHFTKLAFVVALLYFINFLRKVFIPYYVIKNSVFQKQYPSKHSLSIDHVDMVRETKNSIFLHGSSSTLEIVKYKLDKNSLDDLRDYLKNHLGNFDRPKNLKATKVLNICLFFMAISSGVSAQKKIKPIKNPVAWSYTIAPKTPLAENITTYDFIIDSHLSPMDWWDEISWNARVSPKDSFEKERMYQEAISDTLDIWAERYMAFNKYPYQKNQSDPEIIINLKTEEYQIENVQLDVDFSDMESPVCEVNASARLTVSDRKRGILLDTLIVFYLDEENQSTLLPIRHFMLNPVFKMKYNLKRKPEKKRRLLNRKLEKYGSDVLRYFYTKSGEILREHFMEQKKSVYAATFGIKNKGHEALNDASESTKRAINALSALSKKNKKTLDEIKPEIEAAIDYWLDKLQRTNDPEIRKLLHANLSLGNLFLGNIEDAKKCIHQIPEFETLENKIQFQGGFNYYLSGLSEAINTKERHGELAQIR